MGVKIGLKEKDGQVGLEVPPQDEKGNLITTNHLVSRICCFQAGKGCIVILRENLKEYDGDNAIIINGEGEAVHLAIAYDMFDRACLKITPAQFVQKHREGVYEYVPVGGGLGVTSDAQYT